MALKKIKYDSFKRGDTPVFSFVFTPPFEGFSWTGVVADFALTLVKAPSNNVGAAVLRQNQSLTVAGDGTASFEVQPTVLESNALIPGSTYVVEVQLKSDAGASVATASTGTVLVEQDYII